MIKEASDAAIRETSADRSAAIDLRFDSSDDEASYYRRRAAQHRQLAKRARGDIADIHEELSASYLAAADAAARGEPVSFDGSHRAEWYQ